MFERFDDEAVRSAKEQGLDNWNFNDVFQEISDAGHCALYVLWVIIGKTQYSKKCIRAHLNTRGYEEHEVNLRTDSSTCTRKCLRIVLSVIAPKNWESRLIVIKAAFLQAGQIEKIVCISQTTTRG